MIWILLLLALVFFVGEATITINLFYAVIVLCLAAAVIAIARR